jgi:mannose-6-phosphate isomerase-like protein (cupin superfamily)
LTIDTARKEKPMPVLRTADSGAHQMHGVTFTPLASPRRGSRENSVWRVAIPPGSPATPHELTREEILVVVAGRASVQLGDERLEAGAGDVIVVPPRTEFSLEVQGDAPFEALVCLPVGGQARLRGGEPFTPPWAE